MKHIKLLEQFINERGGMTSTEIVQYLRDITPDESDVPDYYIDKIKKSSDEFILKKVKISDLLKKDKSLKEYVMSGEDRYGKDSEEGDHTPYQDDVFQAIVIFNNEVIDGYSRTAALYKSGDKFIQAWTNK
jgi:hypothetical protein